MASVDGSVRTWDVVTGVCVDWMQFDRPCTALALSPGGDFLATAHAGELGICLWANKSHFGGGSGGSGGRGSEFEEASSSSSGGGGVGVRAPRAARLPAPLPEDDEKVGGGKGGKGKGGTKGGEEEGEEEDDAEEEDEESAMNEEKDDTAAGAGAGSGGGSAPFAPVVTIPGSQITLSGLPPATWMTLSKLDIIAARNAPVEPVKKTEEAPFFLPTTGGVRPQFLPPTAAPAAAPSAPTRGDKGGATGAAGAAAAVAGPPVSKIRTVKITKRGGEDGNEEEGGEEGEGLIGGMLQTLSPLGGFLLAPQPPTTTTISSSASSSWRDAITSHLGSLPPSSMDLEVRSIGAPSLPPTLRARLLTAMLRYLTQQFQCGGSYDLVTALTGHFLGVHWEELKGGGV